MATRDSYPISTEANASSVNIDTTTTDHHHQNNIANSENNNRAMRQSLLPTSSRRATMVIRTVDHSQPPVEDPSNTPEINEQRRKEYERVQQFNHMIETVTQDFEQAANNIKNFSDVLDETDQLLDLWTQILSQTQHTKRLLEDPSLEKKSTQHEPTIKTVPTTPPSSTPTKSTRAPAPVGTYMTKKLKTSSQKRRNI